MAVKIIEGFDNFGPNGMGGTDLQEAIQKRYTCQVLGYTTLEPGWSSGLALRLDGSSYIQTPFTSPVSGLILGFACKEAAHFEVRDSDMDKKLSVQIDSSGYLSVQDNDLATLLKSSKPLRYLQWTYVELKFWLNNDDAGSIYLRINGEDVGELIDVSLGLNVCSSVLITGGVIDDLYIVTADDSMQPFLGPVIVETLRPTGDGLTSDWVPSANAAHYTLVNSVPVNASNYLTGEGVGDIDLFTYDATTLDTITAVKLNSVFTVDSPGVAQAAHRYNTYDGSAFTIIDQIEGHDIFEVDPDTSDIWSPANLASATFGVKRL
jgi:hypothetical protein